MIERLAGGTWERKRALENPILQYLRVPVLRVLDVGCGIGLWKDVVARHFPAASFHDVELSDYLCGRFGWEDGLVVDYRAGSAPFDLVICQGVLPYLAAADLKRALHNLGTLCLEAVALEDWDNGILDADLTDPALFRHRAALYRRGLEPHFSALGGGLWLSEQAEVPLFALESMGRR